MVSYIKMQVLCRKKKKKTKSYVDPEIFSLSKSYSTETKSSFKVALQSFVSSFWKQNFKIRNGFTKWFTGSQLRLKESAEVLQKTVITLSFLKPEDITSWYTLKRRNILIVGTNLCCPAWEKKKHRSHLLSLHKLPHESMSQSDSQWHEGTGLMFNSFNKPDVDARVTGQAGICTTVYNLQNKNARLE